MPSRNGICSHAGAFAFALVIVLATCPGALADEAASPPNSLEDTLPSVNDWRASPKTDGPRAITIIESQSANSGHIMDLNWQAIATEMGHTATIVSQETLDDISNLAGTDILIVASGVIDLPPERVQTILQFVDSGGPAYLQGEYHPAYTSNLAFQEIVNTLGGSFTISGTVSFDLVPMNVLGTLATTPNVVTTLPYFWYGCAGTGDATVESFLEYQGDYFGWIFTPPDGEGGLIQTTDEDWIIYSGGYPECEALMENILAYLDGLADSAVSESSWGAIKSLYR
jgi:hypothetical protein